MNKEEILEKSRMENKNRDIAELEVINQASYIAVRAGILVCCGISVSEVLVTGGINYACWLIYFSMLATIFAVKSVKLKRRHEIMLTGLFLTCTLVMLVCYIRQLMGVA